MSIIGCIADIDRTLSGVRNRFSYAMKEAFPTCRWALHATDDVDDIILQIYVPTESERVRVRDILDLAAPQYEGDNYESHKARFGTISIIEDIDDIRREESSGATGEA